MYIVFVLSLLAELLLIIRTPKSSSGKSVLVGLTILLVGFSSSSLVVIQPGLASIVFSIFGFARLINPLRYAEGRLHPDELRRRAFRTFQILGASSLFLFLFIVVADAGFSISIYAYLGVQVTLTLSLAVSVLVARTIYRYRSDKKLTAELPTVTVCVPARNETADLPGCIESILANTYPKLEIIVLDDCSHDKTPEIIKKYAHDGVRFINGKEPREDWLAKNAAYDRLADEARGDLLLFVGVDVRMEPDTINELVAQIDGDDMLSVLPKRAQDAEAAFFIQPIR
jgi:membrane protein implicated in regulation of membrane protease activity